MQKKISSKEVYRGSIFTMSKDEVESKARYMNVMSFIIMADVGVLAIKEDKVLLVKQYRYAIQKTSLEIPAGKLEQGEDPYTCGLRELEEESGYTSEKLYPICEMYSTPGFCNEKIYLYYSNDLIKVENPKAMDEDEEIETLWFSFDEIQKMLENGEIDDAKTIIALQYALLNKENR